MRKPGAAYPRDRSMRFAGSCETKFCGSFLRSFVRFVARRIVYRLVISFESPISSLLWRRVCKNLIMNFAKILSLNKVYKIFKILPKYFLYFLNYLEKRINRNKGGGYIYEIYIYI